MVISTDVMLADIADELRAARAPADDDIRVRLIYEPPAENAVRDLLEDDSLQLEIRTVPVVLHSVAIAHPTAAWLWLPTTSSEDDQVLVHADEDVSGLAAAFDRLWLTATQPGPQRVGTDSRRDVVLGGLAEGLTDAAIAARLGVTERTVRRDVSVLMRDVGAVSRFQLALRARELGWIS